MIESAYALRIEPDEAMHGRGEITAAGMGLFRDNARADESLRDPCGGAILRHIANLDQGDGNLFNPGGAQLRQRVLIELLSLGDATFRQPHRMGEQRALRLPGRKRGEFHSAALPISAARSRRRAAVISAAMAMAISAGVAAPMGRPIGPWMRASALSSKFSPRKR